MKRIFKRTVAICLALSLTLSTAFAADYTAKSADEFYEMLASAWEKQETDFSIFYSGGVGKLVQNSLSLAQIQRTLQATASDESNYDYHGYNILGGELGEDRDEYIFSDMEYLDTIDELEYVEECVVEIVDGLGLDGYDDFNKIKTIYEYMTSSFLYDDTLTRFSAYDMLTEGNAVCQAYAILTCRLLDEAGVNARIISGYSKSQPHAWNQVEWEGEWYNLDTTWDTTDTIGGAGTWEFFMKSDEDFTGHTAYDQFKTSDYIKAHPMTTESYPLVELAILNGGEEVAGMILRVGVDVPLTAKLPEENVDADLYWYADDPSILSVTEDGEVTAIGVGETWLNVVSPENPEWAGAKIAITTVDMTSLSDWSYDIVTAYYLAQMLPAEQCYDFTAGITRSDLAVLADQLMLLTAGYEGLGSVDIPFADIENASDTEVYAILRCNYVDVMNGKSDTIFAPDDLVTREEAAAVLVRVQEYIQGSAYSGYATADFVDSEQISDWAVETVASAQAQGLLKGNDDGTFSPQALMTREQMIVALSRVYDQFLG